MRDLDRFLEEDLGERGDVTTQALFGRAGRRVGARLFTRERVVAAGIPEAAETFERFHVRAEPRVIEGDWVDERSTFLALRGPIGGILAAERLALNIAGRMSGIATQTRRLQDRVARINPSCRVAGTRKTTPGFRAFEKRAIALGGGDPHRYGLYDAILIKDNHVDAFGSTRLAVKRALRFRPRLPVEVEASTLRGAREAAEAGADWLLIDNVEPAPAQRLAQAARRIRPLIRIEVSGGLTPARLRHYAPFADRLSLGSLTHSARSADLSLRLA